MLQERGNSWAKGCSKILVWTLVLFSQDARVNVTVFHVADFTWIQHATHAKVSGNRWWPHWYHSHGNIEFALSISELRWHPLDTSATHDGLPVVQTAEGKGGWSLIMHLFCDIKSGPQTYRFTPWGWNFWKHQHPKLFYLNHFRTHF